MTSELSPRRAPQWMKVALGVSLAINCVVVGVVVGAFAFGPMGGGHGGDRAGLSTPLIRALPEADQRALRRALRDDTGGVRESRAELRAAREDMVAALRQEPFDAAGFAAALEAQRELGATLMEAAQDALVRHTSSMSAGERRAYADRLEELSKSRPRPRD